jgi:hypothetical protein
MAIVLSNAIIGNRPVHGATVDKLVAQLGGQIPGKGTLSTAAVSVYSDVDFSLLHCFAAKMQFSF